VIPGRPSRVKAPSFCEGAPLGCRPSWGGVLPGVASFSGWGRASRPSAPAEAARTRHRPPRGTRAPMSAQASKEHARDRGEAHRQSGRGVPAAMGRRTRRPGKAYSAAGEVRTGTSEEPCPAPRRCPPRVGGGARPSSAVRLAAALRPLSTDSATFSSPQAGDCGVVQIVSTGNPVERPSDQVSRLWIRGRTISTDCGQRDDPHPVHEVVHGQPTGSGGLSPAIVGFSTCLSTVRQGDPPPHRVE
jgi:hypothetical protein